EPFIYTSWCAKYVIALQVSLWPKVLIFAGCWLQSLQNTGFRGARKQNPARSGWDSLYFHYKWGVKGAWRRCGLIEIHFSADSFFSRGAVWERTQRSFAQPPPQ